MATIHQRFEVEQSADAVYQAIARPQDVLPNLPGVRGVTRVSDMVYRISVGSAEALRDLEVHLTPNEELRRVEWRLGDGGWSGAITAEPIGPMRTAIGIHAESTGTESDAVSPSSIHDALQAFKRTLQAQPVHVSYGSEAPRYAGSEARRYASEWRSMARSALANPVDYPFSLMRNLTRQMDRFWTGMWHGTPMARLPHIVPGLSWNPDVEVCEHNDEIRVCVDVPGVDESHLQVDVEEGYLTVRGERQDERGHEAGERRSELHYGAFTRRIPLPDGVDPDSARAVLRNGVLEVRIARNRREARRVPVQHAG